MLEVHDNEITCYVVDLEYQYIKIYTKYSNEEKIIEFQNITAHSFEGVLRGSIILDIDEYDIDFFIKENGKMLEEMKPYCFPIYYDTENELKEKLNNSNQKYFIISSSVGLSGWILAESVKVETVNSIDYNFIVDKLILVGITYKNNSDEIIETEQFCGNIISADEKNGIEIKRVDTDEIVILPPDLTSIQRASLGEYRLKTTGERVINPDLLSQWIIYKNG